MRTDSPGPDRRTALAALVGIGLGAAGCTSTRPAARSGAGSTPSKVTTPPSQTMTPPPSSVPSVTATAATPAAPSVTATTPSEAPLPATQLWSPGSGEISPDVKHQATAVIQALAGWPTGQAGATDARTRITALGQNPDLVTQAAALLSAAPEATSRIADAQYGGILDASASVLVVTDQWLRSPTGGIIASGITVDVRLVAASPHWRVTELHPAAPGPAVADPGATARAVLTSSRITLPATARADIAAGSIAKSVLQALLGLAEQHTLVVSVLKSGHPLLVFGTNRPSDHPRGRAADIQSIDGHAVVDPATPLNLITGVMRAAVALGSYNVGGPVQLSGSQYFSDNTHHDHVHMGFLS